MVARYGMEPAVGQVVYADAPASFLEGPGGVASERSLSEDTASRIDVAVRALVDEAFARASALLTERRDLLDQGAADLLARETLNQADLRPIAEAARGRIAPH
jgi:cell division protease FtsH